MAVSLYPRVGLQETLTPAPVPKATRYAYGTALHTLRVSSRECRNVPLKYPVANAEQTPPKVDRGLLVTELITDRGAAHTLYPRRIAGIQVV